jgi:hypothetical protein
MIQEAELQHLAFYKMSDGEIRIAYRYLDSWLFLAINGDNLNTEAEPEKQIGKMGAVPTHTTWIHHGAQRGNFSLGYGSYEPITLTGKKL